MTLPALSEVLARADRLMHRDGRVALCQIVRTEGSTPGKMGWKMLVPASGACYGNLGGGAFEAMVQADARAKLRERRPEPEVKRYYLTEKAIKGEPTGMVCGGMIEVFLEVLMANPLLAICGGGPVGQALAHNAILCGFDLLVADDRPEFRRPELFPSGTLLAEVDRDYAGDFLQPVRKRELFAAVVTRCWETDLAALASILRQAPERLAYLGLMGSKRKVQRVRAELGRRALDLEQVPFHGPIGLPIGGQTPGEIAVSILAEMIRSRRAEEEMNEEPVSRSRSPRPPSRLRSAPASWRSSGKSGS